ncbi:hypothetical protein V6Z11_A04G001200 [Gossypium hirsutum]
MLFFPAPSPFLLRIQHSLCHHGGSSVPRTSTPLLVHGSKPGIAAKISESRGVAEWDAGERRAARGLLLFRVCWNELGPTAAPLYSLLCNKNRAKTIRDQFCLWPTKS